MVRCAEVVDRLTVHAIVLRRRDAGESDRRLTILTREQGVFDVIAKGARKASSRLTGSSEPLVACIMHLTKGKVNWFVTQVQPATSFPGLRADYDRLSLGLAIAELASGVLPHDKESEAEFQCVLESLRYLEVHTEPLVAYVWASLRLLRLSGFMPHWLTCVATGTTINEPQPLLSPMAGGYVCPSVASRYHDTFRSTFEAVVGLSKPSELERPPVQLKHVADCARALHQFWRAVIDRPLPANEAVLQALTANGTGKQG